MQPAEREMLWNHNGRGLLIGYSHWEPDEDHAVDAIEVEYIRDVDGEDVTLHTWAESASMFRAVERHLHSEYRREYQASLDRLQQHQAQATGSSRPRKPLIPFPA